jgi:hypothetical protein
VTAPLLLLTQNYGFGFRYREDQIWGFWTYKNDPKGTMSVYVYDNFKKHVNSTVTTWMWCFKTVPPAATKSNNMG